MADVHVENPASACKPLLIIALIITLPLLATFF